MPDWGFAYKSSKGGQAMSINEQKLQEVSSKIITLECMHEDNMSILHVYSELNCYDRKLNIERDMIRISKEIDQLEKLKEDIISS